MFQTGVRLLNNQWKAMFKKRLLYSIRNRYPSLMQIAVSIGVIMIAYYTSISLQNDSDLPPMPISLNKYRNPVSILEQHDGTSDLLTK